MKFAIGHLEALLQKYGSQYPRLTTKSARHEEIDAKEVAFKAFKVSYHRESGYVGYKAGGDEFKMDCTKFDKLLLVFRDGSYRVVELEEKLFIGPDLIFCGLPDRDRVFTCAYTDRDASYLKRFTFGGTILNKEYSCIPEKSRILYFAPDTPKVLYVRYKPAPHQKVHQQTCDPTKIDVKSPKTRGRMLSIKDITPETVGAEEYRKKREYFASRAIGGYPYVGTPDLIAEEMAALSRAGIRGIAFSFVNYLAELPYFRDEVLPRLVRLGVRAS